VSKLVGPPVRALMDAVTAEVVGELPASAVVLKIFEAATGKPLDEVIFGALDKFIQRVEFANLDVTLAPGAIVTAEIVDRDSPARAPHDTEDPGAAPDMVPVEELR
jgi:hypothetical protein